MTPTSKRHSSCHSVNISTLKEIPVKAIVFFIAMLLSGLASAQVPYVPQDRRPPLLVGPTVRMCGYEPCFQRDERERQMRQIERYQRHHRQYWERRAYNYQPIEVYPAYPVYPAAPSYPAYPGVSFGIQFHGRY